LLPLALNQQGRNGRITSDVTGLPGVKRVKSTPTVMPEHLTNLRALVLDATTARLSEDWRRTCRQFALHAAFVAQVNDMRIVYAQRSPSIVHFSAARELGAAGHAGTVQEDDGHA
jgi:hypothetical protein